MRLNETSSSGTPLYECDACRLARELNSYIVEEDGRDLCLPCWYEGIKTDPREALSKIKA
jgi:hypothetical protein